MLSPATEWISVLAALPEPATVLAGKSAVIEAVNPAFARLLDRAAQDLVGKELARLVDDADRPALDRAIGTPEAQTVEVRAAMRTGGDVTLALSLGAALDDGRRLILAREVRPEERSQRQLLQYFRDVIDSVGPLVAIFDADDRMIAYNRNYREGYRVGDRDLPAEVRLEGKTYRECMELRAKYK